MKIHLVSAVLNLLLWGIALFLFPHGSPATILHYSAVIGVDFIGGSRHVYVLPLLASMLLSINTGLGLFLKQTSRRAAWILWSASPVVQLILATAVIILWQLNR